MTIKWSGSQLRLSSMPSKHRRFDYKKKHPSLFFFTISLCSSTSCGLLTSNIACVSFFSCFYYEQILLSIVLAMTCTLVCTRSYDVRKNKLEERGGSLNAKYCFLQWSRFSFFCLVPDVSKLVRCYRRRKRQQQWTSSNLL
jgi:hypothetical protein